MGTDINGWVEVQRLYAGAKPPHDVQWRGIIKVDDLVSRTYDMFSCLFGVTAYAQFIPIAPGRGLPQNLSSEVSNEYMAGDDIYGETWIAWSEIEAIDWDEEALDRRPHAYVPDAGGRMTSTQKAAPRTSDPLEEGSTWQVGETVYRVERIARRDVLSPDWKLLFRLMQVLAQEYGQDGVRLVVWFDR